MLGDSIRCTHNGTGGTGTLTLASVSGWPQPTDVFGTSGTMLGWYEITEYTDNTLTVEKNYERGVGSLVLSTNVLTRSSIKVTWNGTTWNATTPTALNFGATAANIVVTFTASSGTQRPAIPFNSTSGSVATPYQSFNTRQQFDSSTGGVVLTNGTKYYVPIEFNWDGPITTVALQVTTFQAASHCRLGLYDWDTDGFAGNLLTEFTSATQFDCSTANGIKTVTMAAKFWRPPGPYVLCFQADNSSLAISGAVVAGATGFAIGSSRDNVYATHTGTYGALPAVADKSGLTYVSRSTGNPLWAGFQ